MSHSPSYLASKVLWQPARMSEADAIVLSEPYDPPGLRMLSKTHSWAPVEGISDFDRVECTGHRLVVQSACCGTHLDPDVFVALAGGRQEYDSVAVGVDVKCQHCGRVYFMDGPFIRNRALHTLYESGDAAAYQKAAETHAHNVMSVAPFIHVVVAATTRYLYTLHNADERDGALSTAKARSGLLAAYDLLADAMFSSVLRTWVAL